MFSSPEILEYHRKLLNLPPPWEVRSVDVDIEKLSVTIDVFWPAQTFAPCPQCQQLSPIKDAKQRMWRHLDTMQFKTFLRCDVPRTECTEHGVLQIFLPWSDPKSRFTVMFEKVAAEILRSCKNQEQAAGLLRLSWKQVHRIQVLSVAKALALRKKEPIRYLGIDEKSFLKGHKYATLLCDLDKKRVLEVAQGRDEAAAQKVLESLSQGQKKAVEAVAMDMWEPFKTAVQKQIPKADIVHDRFHITGYLTKAVDSVRKGEHREFMKQGIEVLKGTKYLWLTNQSNWDTEQKSRYRDLKGICLKVGRAFSMKEAFRGFWLLQSSISKEVFRSMVLLGHA